MRSLSVQLHESGNFTLAAVHTLDLVDRVAVYGIAARHPEDVLRGRGALGQHVSRGDPLL